MSRPPDDKLIYDLVPNDPRDDEAVLKAVEEAIKQLAAARGITVSTPGAIDPTAKENPARAAAIAADAGPKMEARTLELEVQREKLTVPVGDNNGLEWAKQRAIVISKTRMRLSMDLGSLVKLSEKVLDLGSACLIDIATKVGKAAAGLLKAKK